MFNMRICSSVEGVEGNLLKADEVNKSNTPCKNNNKALVLFFFCLLFSVKISLHLLCYLRMAFDSHEADDQKEKCYGGHE